MENMRTDTKAANNYGVIYNQLRKTVSDSLRSDDSLRDYEWIANVIVALASPVFAIQALVQLKCNKISSPQIGQAPPTTAPTTPPPKAAPPKANTGTSLSNVNTEAKVTAPPIATTIGPAVKTPKKVDEDKQRQAAEKALASAKAKVDKKQNPEKDLEVALKCINKINASATTKNLLLQLVEIKTTFEMSKKTEAKQKSEKDELVALKNQWAEIKLNLTQFVSSNLDNVCSFRDVAEDIIKDTDQKDNLLWGAYTGERKDCSIRFMGEEEGKIELIMRDVKQAKSMDADQARKFIEYLDHFYELIFKREFLTSFQKIDLCFRFDEFNGLFSSV